MRKLAFMVGFVAGQVTRAVADPSSLLAPDDPALGSGWRPPPRVTQGLATFAPVEAGDWLAGRPSAGPSDMPGMSMKDMPGMKDMRGMKGMGGMKGMPGMGGGR